MSDAPTRSPYAPPSDPTGPAAPPPASGPVNSWARLVGALTSPGATFRSIAARPTWIVALAVFVLVSIASTAVLLPRIDREQMRRQMRERIEEQAGGKADENALAQAERIGIGCVAASGVGGPIVICLLLAALFLAFNLVGGDIGFRTSLAVTVHALMPITLLSLLSIPVILGRGSLDMAELQQGRGLLPSNLAALAPEDAGPRLLALLASFDLFTLWTIVLLVLGYSIAARVSRGMAAGVIVGLWLLWVAIKVGLAALGGGMG
jgi:Yip1 domain